MCDKKVLACVLLVYATRGQLAEHPRLLHATPCERKVIAARRAAAAIPFNESELAVLEATAVRSAARYEGDSLEVFAHLPHSGGTAWSWRLAATFPVTEIAPGSGFSRGYERNHTSPEPWLLCAGQEGPDKWRIAFSHDGPGCAAKRVVAPEFRGPVHETTMLRSALDAALQDRYPYFLAAVERLKGRGDPDGQVELLRERVKAIGRGWPTSGPAHWTEPDRQTRYVLGTGVERGAFGCSSNRSDTATRTRADVREAARRLAHMPWFGLQHRWLASVCLWHVTTRRPWPAESLPACPRPRQCEALQLRFHDDRRILRGYGVAPASPCVDGVATRAAGAVCPAHVAAAQINVVKAGEMLSTSTSCLLKALCAAGDASDELLAPLARGGAPDDWLLATAERIFDARLRAAAGTARALPRSVVPGACFAPGGFE